MSQLTFVNQSTDQNNSQIVIFSSDAVSASNSLTAWGVLSIAPGAQSNVSVDADTEFYMSVISPAVTFNGEIINFGEHSSPTTKITAGQTAVIIGSAKSGYQIIVS
jgi:hypothetical protein